MAHWQLGEKTEARADFDGASEWLKGYEQRCEERLKQGITHSPLARAAEASPSRSGRPAGRDTAHCRASTRAGGESRGGEGIAEVHASTGGGERRGDFTQMTRIAVCACGFGRRVGCRGPKSLCVIMGTWSLPASRPFALYKSCHCVRMRGKPHRTRWPLRGMCQHTAARGTQCEVPHHTAQEACPALVSRRDRLARHPCEHPCVEQWHAESEARRCGRVSRPAHASDRRSPRLDRSTTVTYVCHKET